MVVLLIIQGSTEKPLTMEVNRRMSFATEQWARFLETEKAAEVDVTLQPGDSIVVGSQAIHGPQRVRASKDETGKMRV